MKYILHFLFKRKAKRPAAGEKKDRQAHLIKYASELHLVPNSYVLKRRC